MDIDDTAGVRVLKRVGHQVVEDLTNLGRVTDHYLMGDVKVEVNLLALLLGVDLEDVDILLDLVNDIKWG